MDAAILFADVSGSTALYDALGDEQAFALIERCLEAMSASTAQAGGRVVRTIGDAVMAVLPDADAAASAAVEMQSEVEKLGTGAGPRLGLRVGFQFGTVTEERGDVFGDTVNVAEWLGELASKGQMITSRQSAQLLSRPFWPVLRQLYSTPMPGSDREVELLEVLWKGDIGERTAIPASPLAPQRQILRLRLNDRRLSVGLDRRKVTFGRDHEADFPVRDRMASRAHATIERRRDQFVLADHSANGTYVTQDGEAELELHREELALRGHGWIAFGQPRATSVEAVEFSCESA